MKCDVRHLPAGLVAGTVPATRPKASLEAARSLSIVCAALIVAFTMVATAASPDVAVRHKVMTLSIVNGAVPDVGDTIRVKQGDDLELHWSSDKPVDLHLHGYDIEARISPQAPATMSFKANIPGRFPIEAHGSGSHRAIVYLEVYP